PAAFDGLDAALDLVRRHLAAGSRIVVHGDYDVDGVCATAILVRALRALGGRPAWYLPSRSEDGYGLRPHTVERLARRGTDLLITADCAITAVDEVAQARAAGFDVLVTDHHRPRADGRLPDAPILHPAVCGYPFAELCAAAVAHKLAEALGAPTAAEDLDLVALATVADVVPLRGENRRLVREGLRALRTTRKPGLRALMAVARVDPSRAGAGDCGFRLAPRINAAGRLARADAGLELLLTDDEARARAVADELDRVNAERRHVEERMLFEAEAQARGLEGAAALVVAAEGWHPGVAGIVASKLVERHHRPTVVIALERTEAGLRGTGSARSIPAFDLLAGLEACAGHLDRHGGHRAAAGLEIDGARVDAFRAAFAAHAAAVLSDDDLVPVQRVDAVVAGGDLGHELAEELERLEPFGHGNPPVRLLLPAARIADPRPMGESGRHVRCTVEAGGVRARAVAFGCDGRLPVATGEPADLVVGLELDRWQGTVEPRLLLRHAQPCAPAPIEVVGEPEDYLRAALAELDAPLEPPAPAPVRSAPADRRDRGIAGTLAALVASGEPVLAVCAHVPARLRALRGRLGGFALCSWTALERDPALAAPYAHVVAIDPPSRRAAVAQVTVMAWGTPELHFARQIHEREHRLREPLVALYRALRDAGGARGDRLVALLRGDDPTRPAPVAGRLLRVLAELDLVRVDPAAGAVDVPPAQRTELERSPTYRAAQQRLEEGLAWLSTPPTPARRAA
ncbi:MAG: single-stranded-DNA-specific exonuclease RecJ, partial [Solirubrobacteraceae bacterium]|nr:single-stranded-DNA-specific exonuclease RecJ [Solirubrobacteraceae bacterium]